ncbi:aldo/keto reductase [Reichenbachiella ulvae]|uniref:Aldo/keto reductase n=1 Tax=Reichenbachiella ulvae TaxID=2980104 RepID=A0ABT3CU98_9BACT|nr:aldo/keto reductase [Reichenbachiella ulvae]MCV9387060.1 aldo/keto reductase [Reichenbachiella ulvae]
MMRHYPLKNGDQFPALGLGTWKSEKGEAYDAIREAIRLGYRHFDCAYIYNNQKEIGQALADAMKAGEVTRKELWITSKLWNTHHRAEDVIVELKHTLASLQLQHLDLYLIHWPVAQKKGVLFPKSKDDLIDLSQLTLEETWGGMEECVLAGLTKHIGVSNFSKKKIKGIQKVAKIPVEFNQIEVHPYLQQNELLKFCQKENIIVTAYAPLGPPERASLYQNHEKPFLAENPVIHEIAKTHQCSFAQVLLAWGIQRGTSVIPKSSNPVRLKENLNAAQISLSEEEMNQINALDSGYRYESGKWITLPNSSYTYENLWDE